MEQLKERMDYDSSMYKDWYRRKLEEGSSNMEHIPLDEFDFGITMVNEKIKMIKEDAQKLIGVTLWERKKPETPEEERELHEHLPGHISSFLGGKKIGKWANQGVRLQTWFGLCGTGKLQHRQKSQKPDQSGRPWETTDPDR